MRTVEQHPVWFHQFESVDAFRGGTHGSDSIEPPEFTDDEFVSGKRGGRGIGQSFEVVDNNIAILFLCLSSPPQTFRLCRWFAINLVALNIFLRQFAFYALFPVTQRANVPHPKKIPPLKGKIRPHLPNFLRFSLPLHLSSLSDNKNGKSFSFSKEKQHSARGMCA